MAFSVYYSRTGYTGNTAGKLDNISGSGLNDGDWAYVESGGGMTMYRLHASGATTNAPYVITPASSAGTKRWVRQQHYVYYVSTALANQISTGSSPYTDQAILTISSIAESGVYWIQGQMGWYTTGTSSNGYTYIKTGSSYAGGTLQQTAAQAISTGTNPLINSVSYITPLLAGTNVYMGASGVFTGGNWYILASDNYPNITILTITRLT
jgi:hypothetical protein